MLVKLLEKMYRYIQDCKNRNKVEKAPSFSIGRSRGVMWVLGTRAPLSVQFLSLSCSFLQKNCQIIGWLSPSGVDANLLMGNPGSATVISMNITSTQQKVFTANAIVSGAGGLHVPSVPEFEGKDSFQGDAFHSAEWDKEFDPHGKTVALIGTGASSVQVLPAIADKVGKNSCFENF